MSYNAWKIFHGSLNMRIRENTGSKTVKSFGHQTNTCFKTNPPNVVGTSALQSEVQ